MEEKIMKKSIVMFLFCQFFILWMGFASAEDNKIEMEGELFVSMEITGRDPSGGTAELTPFILNNGKKYVLFSKRV